MCAERRKLPSTAPLLLGRLALRFLISLHRLALLLRQPFVRLLLLFGRSLCLARILSNAGILPLRFGWHGPRDVGPRTKAESEQKQKGHKSFHSVGSKVLKRSYNDRGFLEALDASTKVIAQPGDP